MAKNQDKKEKSAVENDGIGISDELITAYALENALLHEGKARADAVLAKLFRHGLKKEALDEARKRVEGIVEYVNGLSIEEQEKRFSGLAALLPERKHERRLELDVTGVKQVVLRLAPFPSGPLHIGNARPYLLNDYFAKKYGGRLLLVIDDTIGSEEKKIVEEAYKLIPEGLKWLDVRFEEPIIYKSDRLEIYYKYGEKLIEKGKAYVCFCSAEELRKNRERGIECEHRAYSIEKNLQEFRNMLKGKYGEGEAVLRIKTNMKHKNPAFRDRVIFRISATQHPRLKNTEPVVWPMMEMAWAIDDYLLGITHVIRGKELMIETDMENYIFDIFNWPKPRFIHLGLLTIEGVKLSKSKSQKEIAKGVYFGWDDPRTWSLQSLRRRGFRPEAIREFCLSFGLNPSEVTVPLEVLYSFNRKYVEDSNRYFFIANPILIRIENAPELKASIPLHPNHPERGHRILWSSNEFYISLDDYKEIRKAREGSMFRLMNLFNFYKKAETFYFHSIELNKSLNAKLIHWLPNAKHIAAKVLMPNGEIVTGLLESNANIEPGQVVQFERFGFVKLDAIKRIKADEANEKKSQKVYEFWYLHN
jgi:glutamyl-tRNA synthetase